MYVYSDKVSLIFWNAQVNAEQRSIYGYCIMSWNSCINPSSSDYCHDVFLSAPPSPPATEQLWRVGKSEWWKELDEGPYTP